MASRTSLSTGEHEVHSRAVALRRQHHAQYSTVPLTGHEVRQPGIRWPVMVRHDCLLNSAPCSTAWICPRRRFDTSAIVLSSFSGWGASGANVLLLPASRYMDDQPKSPPTLLPASPPGSSYSSGLSTTAIILIAVLGSVGVTVLVGAFFVYRYVPLRRCCRNRGTCCHSATAACHQAPKPSSLERLGFCAAHRCLRSVCL